MSVYNKLLSLNKYHKNTKKFLSFNYNLVINSKHNALQKLETSSVKKYLA